MVISEGSTITHSNCFINFWKAVSDPGVLDKFISCPGKHETATKGAILQLIFTYSYHLASFLHFDLEPQVTPLRKLCPWRHWQHSGCALLPISHTPYSILRQKAECWCGDHFSIEMCDGHTAQDSSVSPKGDPCPPGSPSPAQGCSSSAAAHTWQCWWSSACECRAWGTAGSSGRTGAAWPCQPSQCHPPLCSASTGSGSCGSAERKESRREHPAKVTGSDNSNWVQHWEVQGDYSHSQSNRVIISLVPHNPNSLLTALSHWNVCSVSFFKKKSKHVS